MFFCGCMLIFDLTCDQPGDRLQNALPAYRLNDACRRCNRQPLCTLTMQHI
jgi:hypothetical protein